MHTVGNWVSTQWSNYTENVKNIGVFAFPESKVPEYFGNSLCIPAYVAENSPEKIPVILDFFNSLLKPEYSKLIVKNSLIPSTTLLTQEMLKETAHPLSIETINIINTVGSESALHFGFTQPLEVAFNDVGARVADGIMTIDEAMEYIYNVALDDIENASW